MNILSKSILINMVFLFLTTSIGLAATWNTFKTVTYTGNGSEQSIELGFKPDLVWIKNRNAAYSNTLIDSVRGDHFLPSDATGMGGVADFIDFVPEGIKLKSSSIHINSAGGNFVAWCWKADQDGFTNSTQTERYSLESGLSIVKYTGDGVAGRTISHSLGKKPKRIVVKSLERVANWFVWDEALDDGKVLYQQDIPAQQSSTVFNNSDPTDSVVFFDDSLAVNANGEGYIAYIFTDTPNVSAFGTYTGSGLAGLSIDLGLKPDWIMIKRTDVEGDWIIYDSKRKEDNPTHAYLRANSHCVEGTYGTGIAWSSMIDFEDTGFTFTPGSTQWNMVNASGGKYIYMAFADNQGPQINFSSNVSSIDLKADPVQSATLSWDVSHTGDISIEPGNYTALNQTGSLIVTPDCSTIYTLTVAIGQELFYEQVSVNVTNGYAQGPGFNLKGPVGVGVLQPLEMLEVNGKIKAKEVIVTNDGWADHVFKKGYALPDISSVKNHIQLHQHLPGIPSAAQIGSEGLPVSKMLELQMEKIEELTLYIIELNEKNQELEQRIKMLE